MGNFNISIEAVREPGRIYTRESMRQDAQGGQNLDLGEGEVSAAVIRFQEFCLGIWCR